MPEQPTIGLASRHLRIFIDVKSTKTRMLGARMSSARCPGREDGASGFRLAGSGLNKKVTPT